MLRRLDLIRPEDRSLPNAEDQAQVQAPRYLAMLQTPDKSATGWIVETVGTDAIRLVQVGDGRNKVDVTYVENLADAHLLAGLDLDFVAGPGFGHVGTHALQPGPAPLRQDPRYQDLLDSLSRGAR